MAMDQLLVTTAAGQSARLALVEQLEQQGAQGLLTPTAALHRSHEASPCVRVIKGNEQPELLPLPAHVILLCCNAEHLPGWWLCAGGATRRRAAASGATRRAVGAMTVRHPSIIDSSQGDPTAPLEAELPMRSVLNHVPSARG